MADATLSGSLLRLTSSITIVSQPNLTLAGSVQRPTSSMTLATQKSLTLGGNIAQLTASVTLNAPPAIALDAALPSMLAAVELVSQPNVTLEGVLPELAGEFQVNRSILTGGQQFIEFTMPGGNARVIGPMELALAEEELERAPTTLEVTVSNCAELDDLTFAIDGVDVFVETSDVDGFLDSTSIPVPDLAAGTHTLTVTSAVKGVSSTTFTLARGAAAHPAIKAPDADPIFIPASQDGDRFHWVLQDLAPGGLGSWVMPVSPTSMTNPHRRRDIAVQHTTAINGVDHAFEGHMSPLDWQFAGYCPDQEFYNLLRAYMNLNRRFYVIDHRGRAWTVAGVSVDLRPRKRQSVDGALSDWHHDYTANCALLDQTWKEPV